MSNEIVVPFRVEFTNGSYILWDWANGTYRVAFYNKTSAKASDMEAAISIVMKKPFHSKVVQDTFKFIKQTKEFEEIDATVGT